MNRRPDNLLLSTKSEKASKCWFQCTKTDLLLFANTTAASRQMSIMRRWMCELRRMTGRSGAVGSFASTIDKETEEEPGHVGTHGSPCACVIYWSDSDQWGGERGSHSPTLKLGAVKVSVARPFSLMMVVVLPCLQLL